MECGCLALLCISTVHGPCGSWVCRNPPSPRHFAKRPTGSRSMATAEYPGKVAKPGQKPKATNLDSQACEALDRAVAWLLNDQDGDGWWCGELEANVTIQ